jgi:hypothetical protein
MENHTAVAIIIILNVVNIIVTVALIFSNKNKFGKEHVKYYFKKFKNEEDYRDWIGNNHRDLRPNLPVKKLGNGYTSTPCAGYSIVFKFFNIHLIRRSYFEEL